MTLIAGTVIYSTASSPSYVVGVKSYYDFSRRFRVQIAMYEPGFLHDR